MLASRKGIVLREEPSFSHRFFFTSFTGPRSSRHTPSPGLRTFAIFLSCARQLLSPRSLSLRPTTRSSTFLPILFFLFRGPIISPSAGCPSSSWSPGLSAAYTLTSPLTQSLLVILSSLRNGGSKYFSPSNASVLSLPFSPPRLLTQVGLSLSFSLFLGSNSIPL